MTQPADRRLITEASGNATYALKGEVAVNSVTSSTIATIRETYDPDEEAAPGEMLVLLGEEFFFNDFSDDAVGDVPKGFRTVWGSHEAWAVQDSPYETGAKVLRYEWNRSSAMVGLIWEGLGVVRDAEMVFRWRTNAAHRTVYALMRAEVDAVNGYWGGQRNSSVESIGKLVAGDNIRPLGTEADQAALGNRWATTRFKVSGSELKARTWFDGEDEPASWSVTATDETFPEPGFLGFSYLNFSSPNTTFIEIDWVGVSIPGTSKAPSSW